MGTITSDNNFGVAKLIVDPVPGQGNYTTIASALAAAVSGQTIFIRPSTYTENPALVAGVNLCAFECDAQTPNVIILGKCTFSSAGTVSMSGILFETNNDFCLSVTGSAASQLVFTNCNIVATNNTAINYTTVNTSSFLEFRNCGFDIQATGITLYSCTSTGGLFFQYCNANNNGSTTTASTNSAANQTAQYSSFSIPLSTSGTGGFGFFFSQCGTSSQNVQAITINGSGSCIITQSIIYSGSASAVSFGNATVGQLSHCVINSTNTNAITGSGAVQFTGNSFVGSSSNINTTTQTVGVFSAGNVLVNNATLIISGSGAPSSSAPKGSLDLRTDGTTINNRAYVNSNGSTGWSAITTVS